VEFSATTRRVPARRLPARYGRVQDVAGRVAEYVDSERFPGHHSTRVRGGCKSEMAVSQPRDGGGTLLLDIPAGWSGVGTTGRATAQEFIISGNATVGGMFFERWGYTCRAPGEAAGSYTSNGGARLICIWDEDEAAASGDCVDRRS